MKIAMLAPIAWRTPPRHYGPWELVSSLITEALVDLGVDVTLFATADSITKGTLEAVCKEGYEENPNVHAKVWECLHISNCFEQADKLTSYITNLISYHSPILVLYQRPWLPPSMVFRHLQFFLYLKSIITVATMFPLVIATVHHRLPMPQLFTME